MTGEILLGVSEILSPFYALCLAFPVVVFPPGKAVAVICPSHIGVYLATIAAFSRVLPSSVSTAAFLACCHRAHFRMDMDMVRPPEQSGANHRHLSLLFVGMQIL
jgi:hypothetical protein